MPGPVPTIETATTTAAVVGHKGQLEQLLCARGLTRVGEISLASVFGGYCLIGTAPLGAGKVSAALG